MSSYIPGEYPRSRRRSGSVVRRRSPVRSRRSTEGVSDRHYRNILNRARSRGRGAAVRPTYAERRKHQQARGTTRAARGEGVARQRRSPVRGKITGPNMRRARQAGITADQWNSRRRRSPSRHGKDGPSGIGTRRPTSAQKLGQRRMLEYRRRRMR